MKIDLSIFNVDELNNMFKSLNSKEQKRVIQTGLVKAANPIKSEMISNYKSRKKGRVNNSTDRIYKFINKVYRYNDNPLSVRVGTKFYLARFLNSGTKKRNTKKKYYRGFINPNYFLSDAIQSKAEQARKNIILEVEKALQRVIKRKSK